ncbi:MAG: TraB/GumN family protein [Fluviicola sp.]|jgi:uncharacterized protein YbaP (TraB family)
MKHLKTIIAVSLFTFLISNSQAQEMLKLENSILWKIEHPELKEPSYLLGTLHLLCEEDFVISEKIYTVLDNIDALVLEVNMSDPEELKSLQASMASSKKISEELTESQFKELDELVQKVLKSPLMSYNDYGLSMLQFYMMYAMLPCDLTQIKSFEPELMKVAAKKQTPIFGLESSSAQLEFIKKAYTTDYLFEQLMLFDSYKIDFNSAIKAYKHEDITAAVNLITKDKYMNENAVKYMQVERNKNWVEIMPQMMKERSNLFSIGCAHLTNESGIINLLRQKGYIITPVF